MYKTKRFLEIIMMMTIGLLLSCSDEINYHSFEEQSFTIDGLSSGGKDRMID